MKHLVLTLVLLLAGAALAHGSLACRMELPPALVCYGEQVLASVGPFELAAGGELDVEHAEPVALVPYVAASYYGEAYWTTLEVRAPVAFPDVVTPRLGFRVALSVGTHW